MEEGGSTSSSPLQQPSLHAAGDFLKANPPSRRIKYKKFDYFFNQARGTLPTNFENISQERVAQIRAQLGLNNNNNGNGTPSSSISISSLLSPHSVLEVDDQYEKLELLKAVGVESFATRQEMIIIAGEMKALTIKKHQVLCREGEEANCFFFIVRGEVICNCGMNDVRYTERQPHTPQLVQSGEIFEEGITIVLNSVPPVAVIIGEDLIDQRCEGDDKQALTYDVTCIAYSERVIVYAVPVKVFHIFAKAKQLSRFTALLEKANVPQVVTNDDAQHISVPESNIQEAEGKKEEQQEEEGLEEDCLQQQDGFYSRLSTVRGMIAILKPNRGLISCYGSLGASSSCVVRQTSRPSRRTSSSCTSSTHEQQRYVQKGKEEQPLQRIVHDEKPEYIREKPEYIREKLKLNFRGTEKVKRAYKACVMSLLQIQKAERSSIRRLIQSNSSGVSMVSLHLQELWSKNPRAWTTIAKDKPPEDLCVVKEPEPWIAAHEQHIKLRAKAKAATQRADSADQTLVVEENKVIGGSSSSSLRLKRLPSAARFKHRFLDRRKVRGRQRSGLDDIIQRCNNVLTEQVDPPQDYVAPIPFFSHFEHKDTGGHDEDNTCGDGADGDGELNDDNDLVLWARHLKSRRTTLKKVARKTMTVIALNRPKAEDNTEEGDTDEGKKAAKGRWKHLKKMVQTTVAEEDENNMMKKRAKVKMDLIEAKRQIEQQSSTISPIINLKENDGYLRRTAVAPQADLKHQHQQKLNKVRSVTESKPQVEEKDKVSLSLLAEMPEVSLTAEEKATLWHDYKKFHLYQVMSYHRDQKSFPVVGPSTFALLWRRKMIDNPGLKDRLKDLKEEDYEEFATWPQQTDRN